MITFPTDGKWVDSCPHIGVFTKPGEPKPVCDCFAKELMKAMLAPIKDEPAWTGPPDLRQRVIAANKPRTLPPYTATDVHATLLMYNRRYARGGVVHIPQSMPPVHHSAGRQRGRTLRGSPPYLKPGLNRRQLFKHWAMYTWRNRG